MAGLAAAIPLHGNTLAAEAEKPPGDEPFFEMRDEEVLVGTIAVAMDGSVLLFEEQREKGIIEVKRSEDGGKTWGPEIEVGKRVKIDGDMSDDGRYKGEHVGWSALGNTCVDENTGDIMVFAASLRAAQILYRSRDHGKTWKTEKTLIKPDVNGWVSAPNSACDPGVTLRYGKNKGRLLVTSRVFWGYYNKGKNKKYFDKLYSNALYSDDGGKTWTPSAPFPLGGTGEAGLVELKDGRIYYNSRTHIRPGNRRIAHSHDGGETWKDEHEDDELFDGPPDVYGCKAGLLRLPYDDRDVLVFSSPGRRDIREDITVWVSFDGGETWPVKRLVRKGPGNYTWLAAGRKGTPSEGMIYLLAGKDWMARFNLAWILEGNTNADAQETSAATPDIEFQETHQAIIDQLDAMLPGVLSAQCAKGNPKSDPHGIYVGQIRSANNRKQESVLLMAYLYQEPLSKYHRDPELLERLLMNFDYICRAQGANGCMSESIRYSADYKGRKMLYCGVKPPTGGNETRHGGNSSVIRIEKTRELPETVTWTNTGFDKGIRTKGGVASYTYRFETK